MTEHVFQAWEDRQALFQDYPYTNDNSMHLFKLDVYPRLGPLTSSSGMFIPDHSQTVSNRQTIYTTGYYYYKYSHRRFWTSGFKINGDWHWREVNDSGFFPWKSGTPASDILKNRIRIQFGGLYIEDAMVYELGLPLCEPTIKPISYGMTIT